jgi:hypothetical protein
MRKILFFLIIAFLLTSYSFSQSQFAVDNKFPGKYNSFRIINNDTLINVLLSNLSTTIHF